MSKYYFGSSINFDLEGGHVSSVDNTWHYKEYIICKKSEYIYIYWCVILNPYFGLQYPSSVLSIYYAFKICIYFLKFYDVKVTTSNRIFKHALFIVLQFPEWKSTVPSTFHSPTIPVLLFFQHLRCNFPTYNSCITECKKYHLAEDNSSVRNISFVIPYHNRENFFLFSSFRFRWFLSLVQAYFFLYVTNLNTNLITSNNYKGSALFVCVLPLAKEICIVKSSPMSGPCCRLWLNYWFAHTGSTVRVFTTYVLVSRAGSYVFDQSFGPDCTWRVEIRLSRKRNVILPV